MNRWTLVGIVIGWLGGWVVGRIALASDIHALIIMQEAREINRWRR